LLRIGIGVGPGEPIDLPRILTNRPLPEVLTIREGEVERMGEEPSLIKKEEA